MVPTEMATVGAQGGFKFLGPPLLGSGGLPQTPILRSSGMQAAAVNAIGKPHKLTAQSGRKRAERDGADKEGE